MKKNLLIAAVILMVISLQSPLLAIEATTAAVSTSAKINQALELTVAQSGQSEIHFGTIQSSDTSTKLGPFTFTVDVYSNTGQRYEMTQLINSPLQNIAGDKIPTKNLTFKTSSTRSAGTAITTPAATSDKTQTIFVSDNKGTSDTIVVEYMLEAPANQPAGDYSALLTYTVSVL